MCAVLAGPGLLDIREHSRICRGCSGSGGLHCPQILHSTGISTNFNETVGHSGLKWFPSDLENFILSLLLCISNISNTSSMLDILFTCLGLS